MIKDDVLGRSRRFEPTRKPIVLKWDENASNLDPELKRLKHVSVKDSPDNREHCFWTDSVSQSFSYITAATIIGTGMRIRCKNEKAREIIEGFNREINVNRKSIEDYITSSWIDEIVHGNSYWRIDKNKEHPYGIDIQRIDPKTIRKWKDPKYAWTKLIQEVGDYKSYRSKASFYARAGLRDFRQLKYSYRTREIHIPDEPDVILRTSFFVKPPIASALHYITYKRYILYFMRKFSQKFWTPFMLFLIGDPKTNYYPDDPMEMQTQIDDVAEVVPKITNFGGLVLPGNVRAEEIGKGSARGSEIYVTYMSFLDKQIMLSIFGSMGLREASGNDLSTQRGVREGWLQFIEGIRRKYKISLENFYARCLLPHNGIKLNVRELDLEYPPLKFEASEEYMRAVQAGRATGMFLDRNELRKAGAVIWNWLEPVSQKENGKIDFQMPIQTGGSMFGGSTPTRSKAQDTRQKVKSVASTTQV